MGGQDHIAEEEEQKTDARIVGCGCLMFLALALGAAVAALCATLDRAFDRDVAAYSICEMCGELLDETNVHAACAGEAESELIPDIEFGVELTGVDGRKMRFMHGVLVEEEAAHE